MVPVAGQAAVTPRCELADVFREYGKAYRRNHSLPVSHLKVMRAVEHCRTASLGGHLQQCDSCGFEHPAYNSCRNRHCPKCQSMAKVRWLEKQNSELLPTGYFHLVLAIERAIDHLSGKTPWGDLWRDRQARCRKARGHPQASPADDPPSQARAGIVFSETGQRA